MYQHNKLIRGNARSLAPIIMGMRKFPSTAGIDGIRKKKSMIWPCMVKALLYISAVKRSPAGVSNSRRISKAKKPPIKKNSVIEGRYSRAIRLWAVGRHHERL